MRFYVQKLKRVKRYCEIEKRNTFDLNNVRLCFSMGGFTAQIMNRRTTVIIKYFERGEK